MTSRFQTLQADHEALLRRQEVGDLSLSEAQTYIETVRQESRYIAGPRERDQLRAILRYWSGYVYTETETYPETTLPPISATPDEPTPQPLPPQQRRSRWPWLAGGLALVGISVFVFLLVFILGDRLAPPPDDEPTIAVPSAIPGEPESRTPEPPTTPAPEVTLEAGGNLTIQGGLTEGIVTLGQTLAAEGGVLGLAFSADGRQLAASGADGFLTLWDTATLGKVAELGGAESWWMQAVAFSANGRWLAAGGNDRLVRIWSLPDRQLFAHLEGHQGFVLSVAFSPDGATLASVSSDGVVKLWQVATGLEIASAQISQSSLPTVSFSPDGATLAVAALEAGAFLLNAPTLREQCRFRDLSASAVVFSPAGGVAAVGGQKGEIALIEARSCAALVIEQPHSAAINSLAFDSPGRLLVAGGENGRLTIGPPTVILNQEGPAIGAVAFSPNGTLIATGDERGTIVLWGIGE